MISSEAPYICEKACELFIREVALRSWMETQDQKRKTLQRGDIATAVSRNEMFDFLIDFFPADDEAKKRISSTVFTFNPRMFEPTLQ